MPYIYGAPILDVSRSHTQRRSTDGRTPLDEWSARRRDLYLTTHETHNRQISMPPVGFEPTISAGERPYITQDLQACLDTVSWNSSYVLNSKSPVQFLAIVHTHSFRNFQTYCGRVFSNCSNLPFKNLQTYFSVVSCTTLQPPTAISPGLLRYSFRIQFIRTQFKTSSLFQ